MGIASGSWWLESDYGKPPNDCQSQIVAKGDGTSSIWLRLRTRIRIQDLHPNGQWLAPTQRNTLSSWLHPSTSCSPPARWGSLDYIRVAFSSSFSSRSFGSRLWSAGSRWALPDFNTCQIECQRKCQNRCQKKCQNRMPEWMPDRTPE